MQNLRDKGEVPYWIPSGASTHQLYVVFFDLFMVHVPFKFFLN